jgi:hypothetical protein
MTPLRSFDAEVAELRELGNPGVCHLASAGTGWRVSPFAETTASSRTGARVS